MQHNPIEQLAALMRDAGLDLVSQGDRWPFLHYVKALKRS